MTVRCGNRQCNSAGVWRGVPIKCDVISPAIALNSQLTERKCMAIIIGVRFRETGRVYYFNPGGLDIKKGDRVVVETARGVECGEVAQEPTNLPEDELKHPLKEVMRLATAQDIKTMEGKAEKEAEAFRICEEKIFRHGLDMKLVNVEANFEGSKIIFHFTADQRVDFRALVRDLAGVFRTRIELRQIGVRDEAKLLGGLGICGRPFCCSQFMGDFHPVSIKMAKEQGLSLNPTKISGTCGRLMCCLKYEEAAYEDALKHLPRVGSYIDTPEGRGMVTELNAISGNIKVRLESRTDAPPMLFHYDPEKGAHKPSTRLMPQLGELLAAHDPEPRAEVRFRAETRSRPEPRTGSRPERAGEEQQPQMKNRQKQQQKRKRPAAPAQNQAKKPPEPSAPGALPGKPAGKPGEGSPPRDEKNWRDRHTGQQAKPAYRQAPAPQAPPKAKQKKPAPKEAPGRAAEAPRTVKEAPRYSEIPTPRRAVAQKAEPPQPAGGRRPWPKRGKEKK